MNDAPGEKLFLLDGMALIYRAHFALIRSPIRTSSGFNTSAIYGFANALLQIIEEEKPTHLGLAMDTFAPTVRHEQFADYKAGRDEIPEDIVAALPHIRRLAEAFKIPVLEKDGYEADDIIGTLATRAEQEGFETFMVTPDKDFAQLVDEHTRIYKPGYMGSDVTIMGPEEVKKKWKIERVEQVIDILGLWGDTSDNIPGVPGIGEKTAQKLLAEYGSVENLLEHTGDLKGKQKERLEENAEQAKLSKQLATILRDIPLEVSWRELRYDGFDETAVKNLCVEFEFNSLGQRLFGDDFKAGRGFAVEQKAGAGEGGELELFPTLKTLKDVKHDYHGVDSLEELDALCAKLRETKGFCFDLETDALDPRVAGVVGVALAVKPGEAWFVHIPDDEAEARKRWDRLEPLLNDSELEKTGHNLKFDLLVLAWRGIACCGPYFDTLLAHFLVEPDQRHGMDFLAESLLGYTPVSIQSLIGARGSEQQNMRDVPADKIVPYACEDADVTLRLREKLEPMLKEKKQEKVFYQIECPLLPVLVAMEMTGIALDTDVLAACSTHLQEDMHRLEREIFDIAGTSFNLNSPKQLGEILFDRMKLVDKPKKTRTGQYATNEQVLQQLAGEHEIVGKILDYRGAAKLKSTYVDALPTTVFAATGRVHTHYSQALTSTGRLASSNPNLQNIPIRTERGQEIRKAFVPRGEDYILMAADYSQVELRLVAHMSGDERLRQAFKDNLDIHRATAARVFGVELDDVSSEMRRRAKMVNFGIVYGISAFGLAQRLRIPRGEAKEIIEQYLEKYPGVQAYMERTIAFCREHGYVETLTGRRRYLPDIDSRNNNIRGSAERNAINMPVQGTAADLIKIAMIRIQANLVNDNRQTKMLLQVHDELVFDLHREEADEVRAMVEREMSGAMELAVPLVVDVGTGENWLEAH